ncbi:unnamed protein product [Brugia timori]|uniref:Uncharacterized protein n=1 Tax=Brugia timori TaxID=42155 RepID=A0A3P7XBQ2_9BILA|nr:unnamed protein product [Brugia timori]
MVRFHGLLWEYAFYLVFFYFFHGAFVVFRSTWIIVRMSSIHVHPANETLDVSLGYKNIVINTSNYIHFNGLQFSYVYLWLVFGHEILATK